jgi:hypothetical protein
VDGHKSRLYFSRIRKWLWKIRGDFMTTLKRSIAALTAAGLFALVGATGANAADPTTPVVKKVALTPEQKAAFDAARAAFKSAHAARAAAVAAAKPAIASAKATLDAALATATTPEAKKAAHAAFKAAVGAVRGSIPAKPTKPVRP